MGLCATKENDTVVAAKSNEPLPLSVVTDQKAREARIRDVFGTLFSFWDKDRDGWLTQSDWSANNQPGQASESAWIEMTRSSSRPDAINKESFIQFYIGFYLPKDEAQYRMFLDHWAKQVEAHKKALDREAERLRPTQQPSQSQQQSQSQAQVNGSTTTPKAGTENGSAPGPASAPAPASASAPTASNVTATATDTSSATSTTTSASATTSTPATTPAPAPEPAPAPASATSNNTNSNSMSEPLMQPSAVPSFAFRS